MKQRLLFFIILVVAASVVLVGCAAANTSSPSPDISPAAETSASTTVTALATHAPPPPTHGNKIAFESSRSGNRDVFVMNIDGSQPMMVMRSGMYDGEVAWSPDGTQLVYVSSEMSNDLELYRINADGLDKQRIIEGKSVVMPAWSPDGTRIVCVSLLGEIYMVQPDGTNLQALTTSNDGIASTPLWSPDGNTLLYSLDHNGNRDVYTINLNDTSSSPHRLTDHPATDSLPMWSPDGTHIVFISDRENNRYDVYTMLSDGSHVQRITHQQADVLMASWSPDGAYIAFTATISDTTNLGIVPVAPESTDAEHATNTAPSETIIVADIGTTSMPSWAPDSSAFAFVLMELVNGEKENYDIYTIQPDGTKKTRLTDVFALDVSPRWSP